MRKWIRDAYTALLMGAAFLAAILVNSRIEALIWQDGEIFLVLR